MTTHVWIVELTKFFMACLKDFQYFWWQTDRHNQLLNLASCMCVQGNKPAFSSPSRIRRKTENSCHVSVQEDSSFLVSYRLSYWATESLGNSVAEFGYFRLSCQGSNLQQFIFSRKLFKWQHHLIHIVGGGSVPQGINLFIIFPNLFTFAFRKFS